jgi:acylphosphatase
MPQRLWQKLSSPGHRRPPRLTEDTVGEDIRRYQVFGKVQGVFFRRSAQLEAKRLRLRGFARNLPDGSVEVIAQGAEPELDAMRQWLHRGPRGARVEAVHEGASEQRDGAALPADFEVR